MKTVTTEQRVILKDERTHINNSVLSFEATELNKAKETAMYAITHRVTGEEIADIYIFILPQSRVADFILTLNRERFDKDFLCMLNDCLMEITLHFKRQLRS